MIDLSWSIDQIKRIAQLSLTFPRRSWTVLFDFGPDSGQLDDLRDDDDYLEPDDSLEPDGSAPYQGSSDSDNEDGSEDLPDIIIQLQEKLLNGYTLPVCPSEAPLQHTQHARSPEAELMDVRLIPGYVRVCWGSYCHISILCC
jgi:hypothetical protein